MLYRDLKYHFSMAYLNNISVSQFATGYTNETLMNLQTQKARYKSRRVPHGSII